jgi:hypothetical protein
VLAEGQGGVDEPHWPNERHTRCPSGDAQAALDLRHINLDFLVNGGPSQVSRGAGRQPVERLWFGKEASEVSEPRAGQSDKRAVFGEGSPGQGGIGGVQ